MKIDTKSGKFIWFILIILALIRLVPLINTGFVAGDDIYSYMAAYKGYLWGESSTQAQNFGRFYFIITQPLYTLPFLAGVKVAKVINIIFLLGCFIAVSLVLTSIFKSKWIGYLSFLFSITFLPIRDPNNPAISYPGYFTLSFLLVLLGIYFAIICHKTGKRRLYILSLIFYATGLLFYEVYLFYLPLLIFIIGIKPFRDNKKFRDKIICSLKRTMPFILAGVAYLTAYFVYRVYYPAQYDGTALAEKITLADSWSVIKNLSKGAYPNYYFSRISELLSEQSYLLVGHKNNILYTLQHARIEWIAKGLLIGVLAFFFIKNTKLTKFGITIALAILFFIYIYIPHIPLSISVKYIYYQKCCGMDFYITAFFSFFAVISLLAIIVNLAQYFKVRWVSMVFNIVFSVIIFGLSILSDYVYQACINDMKTTATTFTFMDRYFKTDDYKSLPDNACIYAPNLYNPSSRISYVYLQGFYWGQYAKLKTQKMVSFINNKNILIENIEKGNPNCYYLNFGYDRKANNQFICYGKLSNRSKVDSVNNTYLTNEATLIYYSTYKEFSVFVTSQSSFTDTICIDQTKIPLLAQGQLIHIKYKNPNALMSPVKIKGNDIDLINFSVTNLIDGNAVEVEIQ